MLTKVLRNTFLSVGALFVLLATSASGGASDGVLNFSNTPLVRPQPTITTFDAPGAGTGPGQGTIPLVINPAGAIAGEYIDASDVNHGFLRTP